MKHPKHPGVYAIRHIESNRAYVGSAKNIYSRWRMHKSDLRLNRHHCQCLQNAWNKYGKDAFVFEVLEVCLPDVAALRHREEAWFAKLEGNLYNTAKFTDATYGKPCSPEHKALVSQKMMGNKNGEGAHYHGVLTEEDVVHILHRYASGESTKTLADEFGVTRTNVARIVSRKIWWRVAVPPEVDAACKTRLVNPHVDASGERAGGAKLDWAKVAEIRRRRQDGETYKSIADSFGVTEVAVRFVCVGRTWKSPPKNYDAFVPPPKPETESPPSPLLKKSVRKSIKRRPHSKPRPAREPVPCESCGKELLLPPCKIRKYKSHYCSKPCKIDGMSRRARKLMEDPARREHLAAMNRGKKASAETRAKMSASLRKRSANRVTDAQASTDTGPSTFGVQSGQL